MDVVESSLTSIIVRHLIKFVELCVLLVATCVNPHQDRVGVCISTNTT
jgi:hypothetical protein